MISLEKILQFIEYRSVSGSTQVYLEGVEYDSRHVHEGDAFVAITGLQVDGHQFVRQAYDRGARVFFVENEISLPQATVVRVANTRKALADISRVYFNFPEKRMKFLGITGTNGKTTTAYMLFSILHAAGWKPGLISTIQNYDGKSWVDSIRTTPESLDLFRNFDTMSKNGLKSVVMEVSSHALSLHRVRGISFEAGIFTNLGRDHLDFHKDMQNYFLAKRKLFENFTENQKAILNLDDPYSARIRNHTEGEIFTFSMSNGAATVNYRTHKILRNGMQIQLDVPSGQLLLETGLLGDFNIYNIMAVVTAALSVGIREEQIVEGVKGMTHVPGRCERYETSAGVTVYIDYAHTPDGLINILKAVWETRPRNLIVVFGAGGDRDQGKRPEMGKAAEDFADLIYLTNDNPRSENPQEIIQQIQNGIFDQGRVTIIPDRRTAIYEALGNAGRQDAVVIAGKGHETYQEIEGKRLPFDDHEVVETYLRENNWEIQNNK